MPTDRRRLRGGPMIAALTTALAAACSAGRGAPAPPASAVAPKPPPPSPEACGRCTEPTALEVSRVSLLASPRRGQFHLEAVLPAAQFADANPLLDDVTIALRDPKGDLLCAAVRHQYWTKKHRNYRFQDRGGRRTGGLASGTLAIRRDGAAVLRVASARIDLARPNRPELTVTVRVGERCATAEVQARRESDRSFVFP